MKSLVLTAVVALGAVATSLLTDVRPAAAGMSYECWTYKGGHPDKMVHVVADNNADAVTKAIAKFDSIGISGLPVKCK